MNQNSIALLSKIMGGQAIGPMGQLLGLLRSGHSAREALGQVAMQDPRLSQVAQLVGQKNPEQLRAMVENMARERGTTVEEIAKMLGL